MKLNIFRRIPRRLPRPTNTARRRRRGFLRFEQLEDRRLLAADLEITDAYLVDSNFNRINNPVLGEQMAIRVEFATTELPSDAQYRIEFQVDGLPLSSPNLTTGAGQASTTGTSTVGGWFATAAEHQVFIRIDADNNVFEEDELNNIKLFTITPVPALLPSKFIWPIDGQPFSQLGVTNYVDLDPRPGLAIDYQDGTATIDGHSGLDVGPATFRRMDDGIAIFAAADGVVGNSRDGEFDRQTGAFMGTPSNHVILDHGNGFQTHYLHLRRDSVRVTTGQLVKAGDIIGLMGSSGASTAPHLHFAVTHRGRVVEPLVDQPTYFAFTPLDYVGDTRFLYDSGVTNYDPGNHLGERPSDLNIWRAGADSVGYAWGAFSGLREEDELEFVWRRPDGEIDGISMLTVPEDLSTSQLYVEHTFASAALGVWTVEYLANGEKLGEETFEKTPQGEPKVRLERFNGDIVLNGRYTPIDYGQGQRDGFAPQMTFRVVNHGGEVLVLDGIRVPRGFRVVTAPPPSLNPGASATFAVELETTEAGYFGGEIHLETNDPDNSNYRFSIEGRVTTPGFPPLLSFGIGERSIEEDGGRTVANVRRTGNLDQPLTVTLSANDPTQITMPSTVTIPAGADRAVFFIDGRDDGIVDGIQTVTITASATGFAPAHNTLDVVDFPNEPPFISPIDDVTIFEDTVAGPIPFTIGDAETPASSLVVAVMSSNHGLVPPQNISLTGSAANRALTLTPLPDQFGVTTITVTVTDEGGRSTSELFDLIVINVNDPPTDITLVPNSIEENTDTVQGPVDVGILQATDPDPDDIHTFTLVAGPGDDDNSSFQISGNVLQVRRFVDLDFETQSTYSIRVSASDGEFTFEKALTVFVIDVNEPPTDILLSNESVLESADTFTGPHDVGTLFAPDPDAEPEHVFTLVAGPGDDDNAKFQITDSTLQIRQGVQVDFASQSEYSVRVRVTDGPFTLERVFTIEVIFVEKIAISLTDESISEFNGATTGVISRSDTEGELLVMLTSSDTSTATVDSSVVIPDGETTSAPFTITAVDNSLVDGTRSVLIVATAEGFPTAFAELLVTDHEELVLVLADASISENGGATAGRVTRTDPRGALVVALTSSDTTQATVPPSVTIPDGQLQSPLFVIAAVDDGLVTGPQVVTISASAEGYISAAAQLEVTDWEELVVSLADASISENGGTTTLIVTRTDPRGELIVQLSNSDPGSAMVPSLVVIPDGEVNSPPVTINAIDNDVLDGDRVLTVGASAPGYVSASALLTVTDFEELFVTIEAEAISENGEFTFATVSRGNKTDGDLTVFLISNNTNKATVPASVVIPDGQTTSDPFLIQAHDDDVLGPTAIVTITATAEGYVAGTETIQVLDHEPLTVTLADSSISENGGITTAQISRTDASTAAVVMLTSSDPSKVTLPSFVLMNVGQQISAPIFVTAIDNSILDGTQLVTITASADRYVSGSAVLEVTDFEPLTLQVQSLVLVEGQSTTATVTRTDPRGDLTVTLVSSDTAEATVTSSVVIPDGETVSPSFTITAVADGVADGTTNVTITASAEGYVDATALMSIVDARALTLSIADAEISENGGITTATVTRSDAVGDVTVTLSSDRTDKATVPSSIVILHGQTVSDPFTITAVDNDLLDGTQTVQITASATGYFSDTRSIDVLDHEELFLSFDTQALVEMQQTTATLTRGNTDNADPLVVTLTAQTDRLNFPSQVTIPGGQASVSFTIEALFDPAEQGTETIAIEASAAGYVSGLGTVEVADNPTPHQNPNNPLNVNDDPLGQVSPVDVGIVITEINLGGSRALPPPSERPLHFIDVNGDNQLSPIDALIVINFLNQQADAEGERTASAASSANVAGERLWTESAAPPRAESADELARTEPLETPLVDRVMPLPFPERLGIPATRPGTDAREIRSARPVAATAEQPSSRVASRFAESRGEQRSPGRLAERWEDLVDVLADDSARSSDRLSARDRWFASFADSSDGE